MKAGIAVICEIYFFNVVSVAVISGSGFVPGVSYQGTSSQAAEESVEESSLAMTIHRQR